MLKTRGLVACVGVVVGLAGGCGGGKGAATDARAQDDATDGPFRIICLGKTKTAAIPPTPVAGKLIWTSSGTYQPPQAITPDQICQGEKPASVTTAAALIDYSTRSHAAVLSPTAKYYRVDGTLVGTGDQLATVTNLESGLWQDAAGNYLGPVNVGTGGGVGPFAGTCGDWTSSTGMVAGGDITDPRGEQWWRAVSFPCATMDVRFYCVQTAP